MPQSTARDLVWAAMLDDGEYGTNFKVDGLQRTIRMHYVDDRDDVPSKETIRRVLNAAAELGIVSHKSGSPYYRIANGYQPGKRVYGK